MDYSKLEKNIISVIKEAQIKLGYDSIDMGINYITASLCHLLGECKPEEVKNHLKNFADSNESKFGKIDIIENESGYRLNIPAKGVDYVHTLLDENEFLVKFIKTMTSADCTIEKIIDVFKSFSDNVTVEKTDDNDEFDYLIYFNDGEPDDFWYCIDLQDIVPSYHRFTKQDYLDFGF